MAEVAGHGRDNAFCFGERLLESGYFRAKMAQENLIKASGIPYTIVRATQFFEFVGGIAQLSTEGQKVRLPPALMQPIASDDVAAAMADAFRQQLEQCSHLNETNVRGTVKFF